MTATGYRRRQRRKGYPRQTTLPAMPGWQARVLRAHGVHPGRLHAALSYRGRGA